MIILNAAPPFLKQQIFNKGREALVRDHESWVSFKVKGYREYFTIRHAVDIVVHNFFVILQNVIDVGTHIIADDNLGDMVFLMDIPDIAACRRGPEHFMAKLSEETTYFGPARSA